MLVDDKPSLDEAYLEHIGIKGMRWGVRKGPSDDSGSTSGRSGRSDEHGGITITQSQKRKAIAAAGILAVGGGLYATGNLKVAAVGGGKLALNGAVVATRVIGKVGAYTLKTVAETVGVILGTTAKSAGNIAIKTVETVANSGRDPATKVVKLSGRQKIASLASKLRPRRRPKAPIQLYPTTSIFSRGRGKTRITDMGDIDSRLMSFTENALRRGGR